VNISKATLRPSGLRVVPWLVFGLAILFFNLARAEPRDDWLDPATGHRLLRLSRIPGESESFYFHQNAFTAAGDKMVFANLSTNRSRDFMLLDWKTKTIEKLTDGGTNRGEVVAPKSRKLYYMQDSTVYSVSLDSDQSKIKNQKSKIICSLPKGWRGLTINSDETILAGAFGEGAAEISKGQPRSYWFKAIHAAKLPHSLFTIEIATGKTNIFHRGNDWFNHLQFSPTDPTLLMFCHEGPWQLVDRVWTIRTDGTGLRLMHERTIEDEIAGHEFWAPDGQRVWFDLQVPRGETFYVAGADVPPKIQTSNSKLQRISNLQPSNPSPAAGDSEQSKIKNQKSKINPSPASEIHYSLRRNEWSVHFNISKDGKLFAGDGGAPNMVAHAEDGKWIYLFTPEPDGAMKAQRLVNMSKHDYALEPNVNFTPDAKWVVFRANFDGSSQVYAVEVARR
jgi:oligogalacturonide lyase